MMRVAKVEELVRKLVTYGPFKVTFGLYQNLPPPTAPDLGEPTHILVPCGMPKEPVLPQPAAHPFSSNGAFLSAPCFIYISFPLILKVESTQRSDVCAKTKIV